MPKPTTNPLPDPLPSEGGSYLLDPATGKWELLDRTEPAAPLSDEASTELPIEPDAKPSTELLDAEPSA